MKGTVAPMRRWIRRHARRVGSRLGLDVVAADHYSPILRPAEVSGDLWDRPDPMPGVELDLDAQLAWIESELTSLVAELQERDFPIDNGWYGPMDAHILYALLRREPPRRVVELGSGYSTLVIELAAPGAEHHVVDPFPSPLLTQARGIVLHRASGADVPAELFEQLEAGDLLFIDSSHVVKPGGEVVRVILEVLPMLAPGVLIHVHDIYRPFAYPRVFPETLNLHWQEQYLVQALLCGNEGFELLLANHAIWRLRREAARRLFPGLREGMEPSGLWLRRR